MRPLYLLLLVISVIFVPPSWADTDPYKSQRRIVGVSKDVLIDVPVYDSHSKSYFKFVYSKNHGRWDSMNTFAQSQFFKGVRGRLAVIRSQETQNFINQVIRPPNETWIGLRIYCRGRKLYWVTGEKIDRKNDYTNWGKEWQYKNKYTICRNSASFVKSRLFGGIALVRYRGVIRWWAIIAGHGTNRGLIEFPTGKP